MENQEPPRNADEDLEQLCLEDSDLEKSTIDSLDEEIKEIDPNNDDLETARREEYDSLRAIYADDNIKFKEWDERFGFTIRFGKVGLEVVTGPGYPAKSPLNICVTGLPYNETIQIMKTLTSIIDMKRGEVLLFDLIDEVCAFQANLTTPEEETTTDIPATDPFNYVTHADAAKYMSGITMKMIASRLAEDEVTITHAELVLNPSLVKAFDSTHTRLKKKYSQSYHYDKYTSTELVFHGTRRQYIANIIARGFVKPGDVMNHKGDTLEVRCGSSFGRGTYTSPEPRYAMHYSDYTRQERRNDFKIPGQKLIVCAILMGRRFVCEFGERRGVETVEKGYDSHVSATGFEYVVFNSAQLLPLYVLHLTDGKENLSSFWAARILRGPPLRWAYNALAERKRTNIDEIDGSETDLTLAMKRKIMTKLARKHFPFGYGPAQGTKFVVEEIGEVDEDDEEWGEYQLDRNQYERDGEGIKYHSCTKTGHVPELAEEDGFIKKDEFQAARFKSYS